MSLFVVYIIEVLLFVSHWCCYPLWRLFHPSMALDILVRYDLPLTMIKWRPWMMSMPLCRFNLSSIFSGSVSFSWIIANTLSVISLDGADTVKSSTWRRKKILWPSTVAEYKHGSCVDGMKSFSLRMPSIIFAHSLGLWGWPCKACCTGSTCPLGIGGRF